MTYGLPHISYGALAFLSTKKDKKNMLKTKAVKEL